LHGEGGEGVGYGHRMRIVKKWKITYASPFFGWNSLRNKIEFQ
jgi:hypothetical protein